MPVYSVIVFVFVALSPHYAISTRNIQFHTKMTIHINSNIV